MFASFSAEFVPVTAYIRYSGGIVPMKLVVDFLEI